MVRCDIVEAKGAAADDGGGGFSRSMGTSELFARKRDESGGEQKTISEE